MATPSKAALLEQLRKLRVEPPVDASSQQLQDLVKRVKALPASPVPPREKVIRAPLPSSTAPPLVPPRPLASTSSETTEQSPARTHVGNPPGIVSRPVTAGIAPAIGPRSDHDARPWDPHAGW